MKRYKNLNLKKNTYVAEVDDMYIMLSIHPFEYFQINETFYTYWCLIGEHKTYEKVLNALTQIYDQVPMETLQKDFDMVISHLKINKLLK